MGDSCATVSTVTWCALKKSACFTLSYQCCMVPVAGSQVVVANGVRLQVNRTVGDKSN